MFRRSISLFLCILVAVITAADYRGPDSITGSHPEVTTYRSRTDYATHHAPEDSGTTPTTQPHSDHRDLSGSGHESAPPTTLRPTHPPDDTDASRMRAPPPATTADSSGATPTPTPGATQPLSDRAWTASSEAPPVAACPTTPLNDTAVSLLQSLSADEKGRRLIQAAKQGAVGQLRALLAAGADVGARDGEDSSRSTALHWAAISGEEEAAICLLAERAEVDARDIAQDTPLHEAARRGHTAVVRLLLQSGADVNARNSDGYTPLHLAALHGRADVAAALIQAGADRSARFIGGRTALDLARLTNKQQLVDMLS